MIARAFLIAVTLAAGAVAQAAPAVTSLSPADNATGVAPGAAVLTVTFDRDMDTRVGWSICGGGPTFPTVEGITWRDARTLVVRARLEPGVRYEMPLNCAASAQRFRSAKGERLPPTPWSFTTEDDRIADEAQRERNLAALVRLRELIDTEYSYRDRIVEDWDAVFESQQDRLSTAPTDASWTTRAAAMLAAAHDTHLWIGVGGERGDTFRETRPANYDLRTIERVIPDFEKLNDTVWHGTLDADGIGKVGYLLIHVLSNPRQADLFEAHDVIDELASDCDAMVLDLRPNGGGNEILAMPFAAWFVDGRKVYAGHFRKSPKTGAFDDYAERVITGNRSGRRFDGEVAVLIGPHCVSSCEAFVLMMRQAENATLVGARTRGSSGNPQPHDLGNGVTVWLPSWRATDAAGVPFEGVGIAPDVEVATAPGDFEHRDPVLKKALEVLRQE